VIFLFGDQAFMDIVLHERELAIFRAHWQRCSSKERAHYLSEDRAEILQAMRLCGWASRGVHASAVRWMVREIQEGMEIRAFNRSVMTA